MLAKLSGRVITDAKPAPKTPTQWKDAKDKLKYLER